MSDTEEDKPFAVECAKTGRAKCKKCKCPIEKDSVRIAKLMTNPFGEGKMKSWHHVSCLFEVFAKQRASTKKIDDPQEDISGWDALADKDKKIVLDKLADFNNSAPYKKTTSKQAKAKSSKKEPKNSTSSKTRSSSETSTTKKVPDEQAAVLVAVPKQKVPKSTRDDTFREFRRLCVDVATANAYTEKTSIVRKLFTKGTDGDGFKSDVILWCRMLLPNAVKKVYNLQSKQLVKLFSRLLCQDEDEMLEHLEQGDVSETIQVFFDNSSEIRPRSTSLLTIQEVDQFLQKLSQLTKEDEQIQHFKSIVENCTSNDLKMIIRLIKHDLRINAGPKHILDAIHQDAYEAFQVSRDLTAVVARCSSELSIIPDSSMTSSATKCPSESKVALALMTPVLPMLAQPCKSVEIAMKKCQYGMLSEVKYDGERIQIHKKGSEFRYFSRSLKSVLPHKVNHFKDYIPKAFPDGDDLILDTEILMINSKTGLPLPFGTLGVHKRAEFKDANVCLFVFDCMYYNGEILMDKTMKERRKILTERMTEIPNRIMLSEVEEVRDPKQLAEMIAKILKMGLEGLVLKDVAGKYEPGKRHWMKVKKDYLFDGAMADSADLVVLGAWYGTGNKGGMMSVFLMGCYDADRDCWVTVTKVHSGHDDATLEKLQSELDMVKIGKDTNLVPSWLLVNKPMVPNFIAKDPKKQPVWEIVGAEFTNQGVHTADGISIRFPRVTRIRDDKDWASATTLNELRALFAKSSESVDLTLLLGSSGENNGTVSLDKFANASSKDGPELKRIDREEEPAEVPEKRRKVVKEYGENRKVKSRAARIKERPSTSLNVGDDRVEMKNERTEDDPTTSSLATSKKPNGIKSDYEIDDENRAEYYAFIDDDYIEFSADGSPLNWIEKRKPAKGLPSNAKPISQKTDVELQSKGILKNVRVSLARDLKGNRRKNVWRTLKTLGATILKEEDCSRATHVVHGCKKILATFLQNFSDIPKSARHVNESWVEAFVAESKMQDVAPHAVELVGVYCTCPCPHRA